MCRIGRIWEYGNRIPTHRRFAVVFACVWCIVVGCGWKNGGTTAFGDAPKFGTHDWISAQALKVAIAKDGRLKWITNRREMYLLGSEAPDTGARPSQAVGAYPDTRACHCVLYAVPGSAVRVRAAIRTREEYEKALAAALARQLPLAAFYLGALSHYLADLSQFMHLMGTGSRWGTEDQRLHAQYETAIEKLEKQSLRLRVGEIRAVLPHAVALEVAFFVDTGGGDPARTPGMLYTTWKKYGVAKRRDVAQWDATLREATQRNIGMSIGAIAKLLVRFQEESGVM